MIIQKYWPECIPQIEFDAINGKLPPKRTRQETRIYTNNLRKKRAKQQKEKNILGDDEFKVKVARRIETADKWYAHGRTEKVKI
jgi:hypothetical protein